MVKNIFELNISKHVAVAEELKKGFAYKCYCSEEEINEQKENVKNKNTHGIIEMERS